MEDDIVVVTLLSESRKILAGSGSVVIVELDDDRTLRSRQKVTLTLDLGILPLSSRVRRLLPPS